MANIEEFIKSLIYDQQPLNGNDIAHLQLRIKSENDRDNAKIVLNGEYKKISDALSQLLGNCKDSMEGIDSSYFRLYSKFIDRIREIKASLILVDLNIVGASD